MTAVAAFFVLLMLFFSGCQNSCNRSAPASAGPQSPSAIASPPPTASTASSPSATASPGPTATPLPTPVPYTQRNFPALSNTVIGKEFDYTPDDVQEVHLISARLGEDSKLIAKANHVSRFAIIDSSHSLHIDNQHIAPCDISNGILINLPQRMLFYYKDGKLDSWYPVAIGKPEWETPTGAFSIITKTRNPVWEVPEDIQEEMEEEGREVLTRVGPGPGNPLGNYWMGTSISGIGIHATNAPASIYSYHTHGCIRLDPDNARALYKQVSKGTTGMIVYEPVMFARTDDGLIFLEVDRDIYEEGGATIDDAHHVANSLKIADVVDWTKAAAIVEAHDGIAHDVTASK